jgi:oligopeptide/dipeptide ABC transporter ATP-binding protein
VLLDIRDLTITGRGRAVVQDVSITVGQNESVGIVGESGSGKTMTTRAVLQLLPPGVRQAGGTVSFRQRDIARLGKSELRRLRGRDIGYVPQDPFASLDPLLTVGEQITEVVRAHAPGRARLLAGIVEIAAGIGLRRRRRQMFEQAASMLEQVGITEAYERARQYPGTFSGGMRQRAVIAAAIVLRPALLIADEPTTALDATIERGVLDLLRELRRNQGMSLLLVSHDLDVIAWSCDRAYVMYQGRVMESAPVAALLRDPRHPYTAALVSSSRLVKTGGAPRAGIEDREYPVPPGAGCPFAPRCPRVQPQCPAVAPPRSSAGRDHEYWCHNPNGVGEHG